MPVRRNPSKSVSESACLHHAMWVDHTETCCSITRGAFTPLIEDQDPAPICYLAMGRDVPGVDQVASCELVRALEGPGSSRTDQLGEQLQLLLCIRKAHFVIIKVAYRADHDAFLS